MTNTAETSTGSADARSRLPAVSALLEEADVRAMIRLHSRPLVLVAIQQVLVRLRSNLDPHGQVPGLPEILGAIRLQVQEEQRDRLRRVINATGIILHTGLGRAVLPKRAAEALGTLDGCCNLQIDLETGLRGKRNHMCERLLTLLTGAEAAMIVNNNAAATFLILAALCQGREVIVSRGQLIEIGGSYRLPDCVKQSGAALVEVGTTNKTHRRDYEAAIGPDTAAVMRVNPSNYRIVGFTEEVPIEDLVKLKEKHALLVLDDLGCGALIDLRGYGLPHEPTVQESLAAGADLVCFSGDKLIGGPQSGIIVGRKDLIQKIKKHPLTRILRVGKLTGMALEQALRLFLDPDALPQTHPTLRMLTADAAAIEKRALAIQGQLQQAGCGLRVEVVAGESAVGGGSLPAVPIATRLLAVRSPLCPPDRLLDLLRRNEPPVIGRIRDDDVLLDVRTLLEGEDEQLTRALLNIAALNDATAAGGPARKGRE